MPFVEDYAFKANYGFGVVLKQRPRWTWCGDSIRLSTRVDFGLRLFALRLKGSMRKTLWINAIPVAHATMQRQPTTSFVANFQHYSDV